MNKITLKDNFLYPSRTIIVHFFQIPESIRTMALGITLPQFGRFIRRRNGIRKNCSGHCFLGGLRLQ